MDFGMNKQFMYVSENLSSKQNTSTALPKRIVAIHPLAKLAILNTHGEKAFDDLKKVVTIVLQVKKYTNDTKGRIIDLHVYITTLLSITKSI